MEIKLPACVKFSVDRLTTIQVSHEVIIIILHFCISDMLNIHVPHVYGNACRNRPVSSRKADVNVTVIVIVHVIIAIVNISRVIAMLNDYAMFA